MSDFWKQTTCIIFVCLNDHEVGDRWINVARIESMCSHPNDAQSTRIYMTSGEVYEVCSPLSEVLEKIQTRE